jgi:hypothetical protein
VALDESRHSEISHEDLGSGIDKLAGAPIEGAENQTPRRIDVEAHGSERARQGLHVLRPLRRGLALFTQS